MGLSCGTGGKSEIKEKPLINTLLSFVLGAGIAFLFSVNLTASFKNTREIEYLIQNSKTREYLVPIKDFNCDSHPDLRMIDRGEKPHYFMSISDPKTGEVLRYEPKRFDYNDSITTTSE